MIPASLRARHPALAKRLRDTSSDTLADVMGEVTIELGFACLAVSYDLGSLYLKAIHARARAPKPKEWDTIVEVFRARLRVDALGVPPVGLEDEMMALASPRLVVGERR